MKLRYIAVRLAFLAAAIAAAGIYGLLPVDGTYVKTIDYTPVKAVTDIPEISDAEGEKQYIMDSGVTESDYEGGISVQSDNLSTFVNSASEAVTASGITVTGFTSSVKAGGKAYITLAALPSTEYTIKVHYSSGVSKASGLEAAVSDKTGIVGWEWRVGARTKPGSYSIELTGGGETLELPFEVTE